MAFGLQKYLPVIFSSALFLSSCGIQDDRTLPPSGGRPGDLLVVMDSASWNGETGKEVRKCFTSPQEGLPQSEPVFNLISVGEQNFSNIFRTTRNIVVIRMNSGSDKATYALKRDVWARDQMLLLIHGSNSNSAADLIRKNCLSIRQVFRSEDYKRLKKAFEKIPNQKAARSIKENTGMTPVIPADFNIVRAADNLVWIRKDIEKNGHQVSMGMFFTRMPYDSVGMLELKAIIERRNGVVKMVDGPVANTHMTTYADYEPAVAEQASPSRQYTELRGLWNMTGAFMGGPFVHYTFVDSTGRHVMDIDGYVFAPSFDKREYLMEVEAIAISGIK